MFGSIYYHEGPKGARENRVIRITLFSPKILKED